MKHILITAALALGINSHANSEDLDGLLSKIEADISAQRLAKPAGNNALERIDAFRAEAPFDFRITPLIYKLGESYVALANKAMDDNYFKKAQGFLDIAWREAGLTPGLEAAQERNDKLSGGKYSQIAVATGPTAAELKEQKALALAAAAEKKRLDADSRAKAIAEKSAIAAATKKAAADKKIREERDRQRQLADKKQQSSVNKNTSIAKAAVSTTSAAEKSRLASIAAKKAEKAKLDAAANKKAEKARLAAIAAKKAEKARLAAKKAEKSRLAAIAKKKADQAKVAKKATPKSTSTQSITSKESSSAIATYPLSQSQISDRDRKISKDLVPMCQAIIDNDASIILHTESKSDYRWLTVRLTLCTRRIDRSFRLRHSFSSNNSAEPFITLHPSRSSALIDE